MKLMVYLQVTLHKHVQILELKSLKQVGYKVGKVRIWTFAIVYKYEMHIIEVHNLWLMCMFWSKVFWNVKIEHLFKNIFTYFFWCKCGENNCSTNVFIYSIVAHHFPLEKLHLFFTCPVKATSRQVGLQSKIWAIG
jgi:hypothetical protein